MVELYDLITNVIIQICLELLSCRRFSATGSCYGVAVSQKTIMGLVLN